MKILFLFAILQSSLAYSQFQQPTKADVIQLKQQADLEVEALRIKAEADRKEAEGLRIEYERRRAEIDKIREETLSAN